MILGVTTSLNPFAIRERHKPWEALPLSERLVRLRDPGVRRAIFDDRPSPALLSRIGPLVQLVAARWDRMYVMSDRPITSRGPSGCDCGARRPLAGRDRL